MEPNRDKNHKNPKKPEGDRPKGGYITPLMIALVLVLAFSWISNMVEKSQYRETTISEFWTAMEQDQLAEVEIKGDRILYMTKEEAAKDPSRQKACYTGLPFGDVLTLAREMQASGVSVKEKIVEDNSMIMMVLSYAVMIGGMYLLMTSISHPIVYLN